MTDENQPDDGVKIMPGYVGEIDRTTRDEVRLNLTPHLDVHGPSISMYTPRGTRVVFAYPTRGWNHDIEKAAEHLKEGTIYTVEGMEVHSWHTRIFLKEIPGKYFNHVMFVEEDLYVSNPSDSSESNE